MNFRIILNFLVLFSIFYYDFIKGNCPYWEASLSQEDIKKFKSEIKEIEDELFISGKAHGIIFLLFCKAKVSNDAYFNNKEFKEKLFEELNYILFLTEKDSVEKTCDRINNLIDSCKIWFEETELKKQFILILSCCYSLLLSYNIFYNFSTFISFLNQIEINLGIEEGTLERKIDEFIHGLFGNPQCGGGQTCGSAPHRGPGASDYWFHAVEVMRGIIEH